VTHCASGSSALGSRFGEKEAEGSWHYVMAGSGVWIHTGRTSVFANEQHALLHFTGARRVGRAHLRKGERAVRDAIGFNVVRRALEVGLDTIQFTRRTDQRCGAMAVEIVALRGNGTLACGGVQLRRGWRASEPCACIEAPTKRCLNCDGSRGWLPSPHPR
jgi:hypothetical protein